jgi:ribosomal protein L37E
MKKSTHPGKSLSKNSKSPKKKPPTKSNQNDIYPRCSRCGSRTVNLEHLEQELLVTLSLHCLICGHHTFLGRPVIRLLRRPKVTIPDSIKRFPGM